MVLRRAARERRVLITNDRDFAALAFLQRKASAGIILVRMPRSRTSAKAARLVEVVRAQGRALETAMTIVEPGSIRRRRLPARR